MNDNTSPYLEGTDEIIPCGAACEALKFLQQIYHSAPVFMAAIGPDFKVVRLNRRMADFAGRKSDECPGMLIDKLIPAAATSLKELITEVLRSGQEQLNKEISFAGRQGQVFWALNAYPVTYDPTSSLTVSLIIHDISELRNAQISLEDAYKKILALQEQLQNENQALKNQILQIPQENTMIGSSQSLRQVLYQIQKVAPTEATVLITGETGTGKELVARELHRCSRRASQPLVVVNCAALPANLIESELFGHEKGSFTGAIARKTGKFEVASGGTIFLDEIGEMPLELQSKLLRVLQENQFERIGGNKTINIDVRVIAATNRDLQNQVAKGKFREDLFFRLNVFPIHLPSLAERGGDVIEIASSFMRFFAAREGKTIRQLSPAAIASLQTHTWPGNIRELKNVIERAVILCQYDTLEVDIAQHIAPKAITAGSANNTTPSNLTDVEKSHIIQVLNSTFWRVRGAGGAAELLGMKPTTLESKMARLGIKRGKRQ
jgi:PAS domain S-box-containing protein